MVRGEDSKLKWGTSETSSSGLYSVGEWVYDRRCLERRQSKRCAEKSKRWEKGGLTSNGGRAWGDVAQNVMPLP